MYVYVNMILDVSITYEHNPVRCQSEYAPLHYTEQREFSLEQSCPLYVKREFNFDST